MSESNAPAPLVSVIIPVYNAEKYLRETLDCVCNQTLRNIEIICVDDGSTDGSLSILEEYAARDVRFRILQQKNQYAGVARNNGMAVAKGKYLSFLDADDLFEPDMLQIMSARAEETAADIVCCNADVFEDVVEERHFLPYYRYCETLAAQVAHCFAPSEELGSQLFQHFTTCPWDKLYRSSYIREIHNEWQPVPYCNDVSFVAYSVYKSRRVSYVRQALVKYRMRKSSISHHSNRDVRVFTEAWGRAWSRMMADHAPYSAAISLFNIVLSHIDWFISTLTPGQKEQFREMGTETSTGLIADILQQEAGIFENQAEYAYIRGFFRPKVSFVAADVSVGDVAPLMSSFHQVRYDDYEILFPDAGTDSKLTDALHAWCDSNPHVRVLHVESGVDPRKELFAKARGQAQIPVPQGRGLRHNAGPLLRAIATANGKLHGPVEKLFTPLVRNGFFIHSEQNKVSLCLFGKPFFSVVYSEKLKTYWFMGLQVWKSKTTD